MEENEDLMSIFENGQELNFDNQFIDTDDDVDTDNVDIDKNIEAIEGEGSEDVDSDEDNSSEGDDSDDDSSPNLYSSISDVLFEQGLLPSLESSKDIKTVDDFTNAFN